MNKEQYLSQLKEQLSSLPQEEIDNAIEYVEEYFFEAGEENLEQAMEDLGTPAKFAAQIKAEYTIRNNEEFAERPLSHPASKAEIKKGNGSIWTIIFGILSLPISFPLLMIILALILVGLILVSIPVIVLIALIIGFLAAIPALLIAAVRLAAISISSTLLIVAVILFMAALAAGALALLIAVIGKLIPWLIKKLGNLYQKLKGENRHDKMD